MRSSGIDVYQNYPQQRRLFNVNQQKKAMIAAKKQQRNLMNRIKATTTSATDGGAFVMSKCSSSATAHQRQDSAPKIGGPRTNKSKVQTIINGTKQGK